RASNSVSSFGPPATTSGTGHDSTTLEKSSQKYVLTKWAPNSAAIRQARPRYRASRFSSSFPTAVTARTGMPTSSPSSTSFPRFTKESCSWAAPMKIDRATAEAFSRTASFIEVVTFSFERSSFRTLAPPLTRRTMAFDATAVRRDLVAQLRASARPPKDPDRAQSYLGSPVPVLGVPVPKLRAIVSAFRRAHRDLTEAELIRLTSPLWDASSFEE